MDRLSAVEFGRRLAPLNLKSVDRAVALVWFYEWRGSSGINANRIERDLHDAGFPQQNASRLNGQLARDPRVTKARSGGWRTHASSKASLDETFLPLLGPLPPRETDSVIPTELTKGTRGYIEKVVYQVNASYDYTLYDCCAVMCRRLLETLIIELYEHLKRSDEVKDADGHYWSFSRLLSYLEADRSVHVGRDTLRGPKAIKELGDRSAHNRRWNATQSDIDRVKSNFRLAVEELLHLSGLKK